MILSPETPYGTTRVQWTLCSPNLNLRLDDFDFLTSKNQQKPLFHIETVRREFWNHFFRSEFVQRFFSSTTKGSRGKFETVSLFWIFESLNKSQRLRSGKNLHLHQKFRKVKINWVKYSYHRKTQNKNQSNNSKISNKMCLLK